MDNISINMILDSEIINMSDEVTKEMEKAVLSNQNTSNYWLNDVKPHGLGLNIPENMVLKTTLTDESYKLYGINVTNEEIFESLYKAYSENENSLMKNASVLPFHYNLSDVSGSILTNESQRSFRQLPWKLTCVNTVKCIKKWVFLKLKSPLKKYLEAFELTIHRFIEGKKNRSMFSNEPVDCTNEFIYICSESKSINNSLLSRSKFLPGSACSNISQ